jgi:thioesterase domain-containing protein
VELHDTAREQTLTDQVISFQALGDDQPVYAFQAHGLEQRGIPDWTVERAARRNIQMIRVLRPHGPYLLVGYSFGGLIAIEAAHQLARAGEEVGLLVLMDTFLPATVKNGGSAGGTAMEPTDLSPARPTRLTDLTAHDARRLLQATLRQLGALFLRRLPSRRTIVKITRLPLAGLVRFPSRVQSEVFFEHSRLLQRYYQVRPWPGRTLVYRTQENPDDENAWSALLPGSHEVHNVACDHGAILREPHISKISEAIETEIDAILAASRPDGRRGPSRRGGDTASVVGLAESG